MLLICMPCFLNMYTNFGKGLLIYDNNLLSEKPIHENLYYKMRIFYSVPKVKYVANCLYMILVFSTIAYYTFFKENKPYPGTPADIMMFLYSSNYLLENWRSVIHYYKNLKQDKGCNKGVN